MSQQRKDKGFSLIELLVALAITAIIFVVVSSVTFSLTSSENRTKQIDQIEQAKLSIQSELSDSIRWAAQITVSAGGDAITIIDAENVTILYSIKNQRVVKTVAGVDTPLTPEKVLITNFTVEAYSNSTTSKSVIMKIDLVQKDKAEVKDTLRLVATQRVAVTTP